MFRAPVTIGIGCRAARPRTARLHVVGMPLDPVLDAVTVLTPQFIDEAASASSRVLRVVARSYQLKCWFAATICAAT